MPTATLSNTIWSLDVVKAHVKAKTNTLDAKIAQLADGVSSRIEEFLRRKIITQTVIEYPTLSAIFGEKLSLKNYPITAVASIRTRAGVGYTWGTIDPSLYELDDVHGWIFLINGLQTSYLFPKGNRTIEVTYSAGYGVQDSTAIPRDIYTVGLDYVKFVYDRWNSDLGLAESISEAGRSISLAKDLPADVKNALSIHVKRRF